MITVRKEEYEELRESAEVLFREKIWEMDKMLKCGEDIDRVAVQAAKSYCNLLALGHYDTGKFEPAEYFNVLDQDDVSRVYSKINTIKKICYD